MKTLSAIAHGFTPNLLTRAADVTLKERRPCILLLRENPLSRIHITNMLAAHDAGATVMMANPPFYHKPEGIVDLVDAVVARILDHLRIEHSIGGRWSGY
jgi:4-hydroxy-3-polyprenylbenzoate decarboxylase